MSADSHLTDRNLLLPEFYAEHGYPHEAWARLRRADPVHRVEEWDGPPYWALTRQEEIIQVSKSPEAFKNAPRMGMAPGGADPGKFTRNLLVMDPPEHQAFRSLVSKRFTPRAVARLKDQIDEITTQVVRDAATRGEAVEFDFVRGMSARIPIWVISEMLGVSPDDWEKLFLWTNQAVGASDPEYQQGRSEDETRLQAIQEMFAYFSALSEARKGDPRDDLISILVAGEVDGKKLDTSDLLSYYVTLVTAGNETTRNAITGGVLALIENPDQFAKLKANPGLLNSFIEETLRYTSPVIHMCRTPCKDVTLNGKRIPAGEPLVLFYPSANRDESVFSDPDRFDLERDPNPHLAFGIGEHFCLGAHVARLELRALFRQLARSLKSIELADPPVRMQQASVGGIKQMKVRYELELGQTG